MLRCCMPTCTMRLGPVSGFERRRSLIDAVSQRLLHIDILTSRTSGNHHGHVLMIGRTDQDSINVLAVQDLPVFPGRERLRIGEIPASRQVGIPDVAHGGHAGSGNFSQSFHQSLRAATRADTSDGDRLVGGVAARGGKITSHSGAAKSLRSCLRFVDSMM